jgi:alpha-ketoglutarate-dependent taurine dioxygenase
MPEIVVLYADAVVGVESFTAFVDLSEVAPWLSKGVNTTLRTLRGIHSSAAEDSPVQLRDRLSATSLREGEFAPAEASHPAYVEDAILGASWPFVMSNYVVRFEGWKPSESMPLVKELQRFASYDEFVVRHYWHQGDLIMWDNRRYVHRATVTHTGGSRRLFRADLAVGWGLQPS